MRPNSFLQLAKELAERNEPSCLRTAVGRAYYATFNAGRQCQQTWGLKLFSGEETGRDHSLVMSRFMNSNNNDLSIAGQKMRDLKTGRTKADYFMNNRDMEDQGRVKNLVSAAERVMTTLDNLCDGPADPAVITAMRNWDRNNPNKAPR